MSRAVLDHLRDRVQHTRDGAKRRIGFMEATQTIEMTKQFVGPVDKMDDHGAEVRTGSGSDRAGTHAPGVLLSSFAVKHAGGVRTGPVATAPGSDLYLPGRYVRWVWPLSCSG